MTRLAPYTELARLLTIIVVGSFLAGCNHLAKPSVVTRNHYEAVKIEPELLDPAKCPWPAKDQVVILNTDLEGADYLLKAYEAWKCENMTRAKISEQAKRQQSDIEKRKDK